MKWDTWRGLEKKRKQGENRSERNGRYCVAE
jgi:hypothetical protein